MRNLDKLNSNGTLLLTLCNNFDHDGQPRKKSKNIIYDQYLKLCNQFSLHQLQLKKRYNVLWAGYHREGETHNPPLTSTGFGLGGLIVYFTAKLRNYLKPGAECSPSQSYGNEIRILKALVTRGGTLDVLLMSSQEASSSIVFPFP